VPLVQWRRRRSGDIRMSKTYIVDIASVYGVDEKAADNLQVRPDSLNQEWLIDQVKKGAIYVCDVIEEDEAG
jgi:DNA-binding transcriptional regulator YdaS (Cro superfamily)